MAELLRAGSQLILKLTTLEKMEGVHGDLHAPIASLKGIEVLDDVIHAVDTIKALGSRVPGVFAMGIFTSGDETIFAIVHHSTPRGLRVNLQGESFDAWIVGVEHPERVAASLGLQF